MIVPANPFQGGIFYGIEMPTVAATTDHFGLVQAIDGPGESIVVQVTTTCDRIAHHGPAGVSA